MSPDEGHRGPRANEPPKSVGTTPFLMGTTSQEQFLPSTPFPSQPYLPETLTRRLRRSASRKGIEKGHGDGGNRPYLAGLQATGHAVLVGAAAAVGQAAVTAVLLCARDVDVTAAIHQQILPFTNVPWKSETHLSRKPAGLPSLSRGDHEAAMKVHTKSTQSRDVVYGARQAAEGPGVQHEGSGLALCGSSWTGNTGCCAVSRLRVLIYLK